MNELVKLVQDWSINKDLDKADSRGQYLKVMEESGEIAAAMARSDLKEIKDGIGDTVVTLIIFAQQNDISCRYNPVLPSNMSGLNKITTYARSAAVCSGLILEPSKSDFIKERINDAIDLLNQLAKLYDWDLKECLQAAYNEISGRTGKIVNGIFVKSEDLPKPEYNQGVWTEVTASGAIAGYEGDKEKQGDLFD